MLARYELALEATGWPELRAVYDHAGQLNRDGASARSPPPGQADTSGNRSRSCGPAQQELSG